MHKLCARKRWFAGFIRGAGEGAASYAAAGNAAEHQSYYPAETRGLAVIHIAPEETLEFGYFRYY